MTTSTDLACPFCGQMFDEIELQDGATLLAPGDYSVCTRCARIGVYDPNVPFRVRKPIQAELFELFAQPYWPSMRARIRAIQAQHSGESTTHGTQAEN